MRHRTSAIVFGIVVVVCLAQISWWILFQVRETNRLEHAAVHLEAGQVTEALLALDAGSPRELAEDARARRTMFASEGAALGLLVLVGIVFFYTALVRERRIRANQHRFLAGATHELKTPLTTIRLGLESLERGSLPPDRRAAYMRGMVREIDRLERGLTNLLTAAGLEASGGRAHEVGDLAEDLRRALDAFHERCVTAEIRCRAEPIESCLIRRDPATLRIVLHNLLDNAVKFTPHGGEIDITLRRVGAKAQLTVTDTGCGIPRSELHRIFERFHRGEGPEHIGGTGLGLALVKELAEAHGGAVHAESDGPGKGARFTLDLPIVEDTA